MGGLDRGIRLVAAAVVAVLFYSGVVEGTLAYVLLGLAGIFVVTSFIRFCPLYILFGLNTCNVKGKSA